MLFYRFRQRLKSFLPPIILTLYQQTRQWLLASVPGDKLENNTPRYKAKRLAALIQLSEAFIQNPSLSELPSLNQPKLAYLDERVIEYPWVFLRLNNGQRLLDVGSVLNYPFCEPILRNKFQQVYLQNLVSQTIVNHSFFFQVVQDIREPLWLGDTFDAVTCISTLEHVGMDNVSYTGIQSNELQVADYLIAVREMVRVVKKGGVVLITVPYGRPDKLGWIQIFGSAHLAQIELTVKPHRYEVEFFQVYGSGWQRCSAEACENRIYGQDVPAASAIAAIKIQKT